MWGEYDVLFWTGHFLLYMYLVGDILGLLKDM